MFVSKGQGTFKSEFGNIPFREGDYLVIPKGIMHQYKEVDGFSVIDAHGWVYWKQQVNLALEEECNKICVA